jgi:hypothetical protein
MNKARPMPIGAMKVERCFSAASMKMQKMSCAVKNISMNKPRTADVSGLSVVRTESGPGKSADTTPAAAIAPRICEMIRSAALIQPIAPMRAIAMVTWRSQVSQEFTIWAVMTSSASTYSGIEKTTTDAEKDPNVDGQRKAKSQ